MYVVNDSDQTQYRHSRNVAKSIKEPTYMNITSYIGQRATQQEPSTSCNEMKASSNGYSVIHVKECLVIHMISLKKSNIQVKS
jgi:hypothetical protein